MIWKLLYLWESISLAEQNSKQSHLQSKSLHRIRAGRHFFGTENVTWAGFGPIGNTEKKVWAYYEQLLRRFFHVFGCKNFFEFFFENVVASSLKSCIISNRAKFKINCVLLYWMHLPARLLYSDFGCASRIHKYAATKGGGGIRL